MGDKISSSPYILEMNKNSTCSELCPKIMSEVSFRRTVNTVGCMKDMLGCWSCTALKQREQRGDRVVSAHSRASVSQ